jgi:hypothetical protein
MMSPLSRTEGKEVTGEKSHFSELLQAPKRNKNKETLIRHMQMNERVYSQPEEAGALNYIASCWKTPDEDSGMGIATYRQKLGIPLVYAEKEEGRYQPSDVVATPCTIKTPRPTPNGIPRKEGAWLQYTQYARANRNTAV